MLDLTGRIAIVTGASRRRGSGAAFCRVLASHGADILFTHWGRYDHEQGRGEDEDTEGPTALAAEFRSLGVRLSDTALRVLDATAELGPPTILVNNAAHSTSASYETHDAPILDADYAVNVRALAPLSAKIARRWPGGPGGRISNLTFGRGVGPMRTELAYAATKGAVEAFTVSLAAGVAPRGSRSTPSIRARPTPAG